MNNETCYVIDDLGYHLIPMYNGLFIVGCYIVPPGILLNVLFLIAFGFNKQIFSIRNHCVLLCCCVDTLITFVQGPIHLYFYFNNGCKPIQSTFLCELAVCWDSIPTQISDFLTAQLSAERVLLVVKPFLFRRTRSRAVYLHYIGTVFCILFPILYYPFLMRFGGATTGTSNNPETPICDLYYTFNPLNIIDLLIRFVPYFIVLFSYVCVILLFVLKRQHSTRSRRLLWQLNLFLIWFLFTWSPWVMYDFIQIILNLTYSIYIDALTTFIIYLNYTFCSTIYLFTFKELRIFSIKHVFICQRLLANYRVRSVVPVSLRITNRDGITYPQTTAR
ncbi:unnamed protein product [Didymodactylos carnosus]|uniref:G-protein coupled receptors family 1 profile domain-containing protein n=1 Tax=Didymodactylos carnosus TaxID=1234261 RepID=A0A814TE76_9BILA|nr:unnamed protein product [Didymodactylos carnosus]CAF3924516.1 unnamed protein product [Didymodactylos carnosus]